MTTLIADPPTITPLPTILVRDLPWSDFLTLLPTLERQNGLRWTYDRGSLELMNTSRPHEYLKKMAGTLIAYEFDVPVEFGGSLTLVRQDLVRGLEPDQCYWIQQAQVMAGKMDYDLTTDPPPDLAIEIDVTNSSVPRQPIDAALGVPEVWRFHQATITVLHLGAEGNYHPADDSLALPNLPIAELWQFLEPQRGELAMNRMKHCLRWLHDSGFRYDGPPEDDMVSEAGEN